jgi:hypothetical protein
VRGRNPIRETKQAATIAASVPIIEMGYNEDAILKMDAAFCARIRAAIEAGLEYAPTSIITESGTNNPKNLSDPTAR